MKIIHGDCRQALRELPDNSIHAIVTSPPYFGLRDYGCDGQIGLEATPDAYVAELVAVFREARRVLRADGTFWLNLGDSYNTAGGVNNHGKNGALGKTPRSKAFGRAPGLKSKDRMMIPARVALALQADGWWLRDEIIWHKPNPMPISVTDRTTPAHEMLYMFSKSARYHYDMEAIKAPIAESTKKDRRRGTDRMPDYETAAKNYGAGVSASKLMARNAVGIAETRQPRSVWSITTKPFKGAHFATFPPDLIRPCILAGCPAGGTVLDPFFGAGTTGLVAQQLGRNAIGIELNPEYAAIANDRITGTMPLLQAAE